MLQFLTIKHEQTKFRHEPEGLYPSQVPSFKRPLINTRPAKWT